MCSSDDRPGLPEVKWEKVELTDVRDIGGGVKAGLWNGAPVVIHPAAPEKASFKAPAEMPAERYDHYFKRLVRAFEDWVNERLPVDSTDQP